MSAKQILNATGVVPGVAYAPAAWARPRPALPDPNSTISGDRTDEEIERLQVAAGQVSDGLRDRADSATGHAAEVLLATAKLAVDKGWHRTAVKAIRGGSPAESAVVIAIDKYSDLLKAAGGLMAERVTDLEDIRDRVIARLRGEEEPGLPTITSPSILLAEDLAPADTATINPELVVALVTELGGPTSHTAIIARQLGVPCIVAVGDHLRDIPAGEQLLVDGARGIIELSPDEDTALEAVRIGEEIAAQIAEWEGPGRTADDVPVQLLANVGDGATARQAAGGVAEGVGLFRTELSFLSAELEPTVEQQSKAYGEVLKSFPNEKVVIRTLDAGSDKPLAFADLGHEDNPALGVRGLRISRSSGGLMERQLDAIAAAQAAAGRDGSKTWVMAPMIATLEESTWFAGLCRERNLTAGAMIEIPAAALLSHELMKVLDFVSIGTNDLSQYTMAADRMSPHLAHLTDPWQPAVLRLIDMTCQSGKLTDTPVGVCGEAAADPLLACVLVGLGVSSLSAAPTALPAVGAQLAQVTMEQCRAAAAGAINSVDSESARAAAAEALGL